VGALGVLLAFGAKGSPGPPVVMSLIFCGAPIVNALVGLAMHPPHGVSAGRLGLFVLGIVMAATGAFLVVWFKPDGAKPAPKPVAAAVSEAEG